MAKYRFFRKNKSSRKVEIRRERVEFDPSALFVCLAAAILVWLYVAGTQLHNTEQPPAVTEPAVTGETTEDEPDTGADALAPASPREISEGDGAATESVTGD